MNVTLLDRIIAEQMRRGLTQGNVLNINAMDCLDPVHSRGITRDIDKEQEIERGDDYEVTPMQSGGGV